MQNKPTESQPIKCANEHCSNPATQRLPVPSMNGHAYFCDHCLGQVIAAIVKKSMSDEGKRK